jgi:hypothetical protein
MTKLKNKYEIGRICSTNREKINPYRILVVKPEGKSKM